VKPGWEFPSQLTAKPMQLPPNSLTKLGLAQLSRLHGRWLILSCIFMLTLQSGSSLHEG